MTHNPQAIVGEWTVEAHSPSIGTINVFNETDSTATDKGWNIEVPINFMDSDLVVVRFDGFYATTQLFTWLDFKIQNYSGTSWQSFNIYSLDTYVEPTSDAYDA